MIWFQFFFKTVNGPSGFSGVDVQNLVEEACKLLEGKLKRKP